MSRVRIFKTILSFNSLANNLIKRNFYDKRLFTPGPLSTSLSVKQAMLKDLGSRDNQFIDIIKFVQQKTLDIANLSNRDNYVSVLIQGSGTFGVESVIQTSTKHNESNYLILENGSYGQRMATMCKLLGIPVQMEHFPEERAIDLERVEEILKNEKQYTHVGVIHSETSSGVLNDVESIGKLVKKYLPNSTYIVDSISAFGALPISIEKANVDFLVSSSNKCIQGVAGFAFVICNKEKLLKCQNNSKSLSLDLYDQYSNMTKTNQFRFTPPVQTIMAFKQALIELDKEGGPTKRYERYINNHNIIRDGLSKLGFRELVPIEEQSRIINSFFYPNDKNFVFDDFYKRLSDRGKIIYPGKTTKASCFRIGNIGDLHSNDMLELIQDITEVLKEMNIKVPVSYS